jgi:cytochrome c553
VLGLLAVVLLFLIVVISLVGWQVVLGPKARAVTARTIERTPARLARGEYLVNSVASCFHCHSEHDLTTPEFPRIEARKGAGWVFPEPDLGTLPAPNITPDPETGLGNWTDDEILRAIQEGVSRDGRALFPIMPYMNFAKLDDEDVASIVVYLRSIPPVKNPLPARKLIFPLNFIVNTIPQPKAPSAPAPPRTTPASRGEYLATVVASCPDCHTPTKDGTPLPNMALAGGARFNVNGQTTFSANVTPDASGIAHYDEALFMQTMHTGRVPGRTLSHIMPFESFKTMTDDDVRDVWAYLKTLTPVKHRLSNTDPPKPCPICGQEHGLGELNVKR